MAPQRKPKPGQKIVPLIDISHSKSAHMATLSAIPENSLIRLSSKRVIAQEDGTIL